MLSFNKKKFKREILIKLGEVKASNNIQETTDELLLLGKFSCLNGRQEETISIPVFLDTGCNAYGIVSSTFVDKYKILIIPISPITPQLADKTLSTQQIKFKTVPLNFKIFNPRTNELFSHCTESFLVMDTDHSAILGLPWCFEHEPKLDWGDFKIKNLKFNAVAVKPLSLTPPIEPDFITYNKEYAKSTIPLDASHVPLLYQEFKDLFQEKNDKEAPLPPHRPYDMSIELDPTNPLPKSPKIYPLPPTHQKILKEYIEKALKKGWISNSTAEYAEPIFIVPKPNNSGRPCVNYKNINARVKTIPYPIPLVQDLLDRLGKAVIFTRLDLPDAYHLIRMKKGDEEKTAFRCIFGLFQFNVVSFGHKNAPVVVLGMATLHHPVGVVVNLLVAQHR